MTRYLSLTGIFVLLLSTSPLAPAAVTLPPKPQETPAERAFRVAGFIKAPVGCRIPTPGFTASSSVGDSEMKGLIDPGFPFILNLSQSHVTDAGMKDVAKFSKLLQLNLTGSGVTLAGLAELDNIRPLSVELGASQITADSAKYLAAHAKPTCTLYIDPLNDAVIHTLSEGHLLHLLPGAHAHKFSFAESDQAIDTLALQARGITDASMKDIAGMANLTTLYLGNSGVTDAGIKELAGLHRLSSIDLTATKLTDAGLKDLAALGNLKSVSVNQTAITSAGLKYFARHPGLWLAIGNTELDPQVLRDIARAGIPTWTLQMACTDRNINALSNAGMLHLMWIASARDGARPRSADDVISIRVRGNALSEAGLKELAIFKNLENLDLRSTETTDAVMASFANLDHLTSLDLSRTEITDAALKPLATKKTLTTLSIDKTHVTEAGVRELQLALPECKIKH